MSHRPAPGRRRAAKPALRVRVAAVLTPQVALKSMVACGLVAAAAASVVLPAPDAAGATASAGTTASAGAAAAAAIRSSEMDLTLALIDGRSAAVLEASASRSSGRSALGRGSRPDQEGTTGKDTVAAGTLGAPTVAAPALTGAVGLVGFEAVAKPVEDTNLDKLGAGGASAGAAGASSGSVYVGEGYSPTAYAGWCSGLGLTPNAAGVCSAVRSLFGITNIGGFRAGDGGDHGTGHAVDVMIGDFAQGDAVAAFLQAHAAEFNIKYLIWRQRYWAPGGSWSLMEDRGSPTQNHMDHVHVSVY